MKNSNTTYDTKASRNKNFAARWYCVKCGGKGLLPYKVETILGRPRWCKFKSIIVCPSCGDDRGHCGILTEGEFAELPSSHEVSPSPIALRFAHESVKETLNCLRDATEALQHYRQIAPDFASWLSQRGVRFGCVADLVGKARLSTIAMVKLPKTITAKDMGFWLPLIYYPHPSEWFHTGLQIRFLAKEPKYVTIRFSDRTPLCHVALPTQDRSDGRRFARVWLTEGVLKAEAIAFYLGDVAVASVGLPNQTALKMAMEAARWWSEGANLVSAPIVVAPDNDVEKKEVVRAWWRAIQYLQREGFDVIVATWSPEHKGIDDALVAGVQPEMVSPDEWLCRIAQHLPPREVEALVGFRPKKWLWVEDLPATLKPLTFKSELGNEPVDVFADRASLPQALKEAIDRGFRFVHIALRTGEGKTHAALRLRRKDLRGKRLVFIHPAPHQLPDNFIPKGWHRVFGRSHRGYIREPAGGYREANEGEKPDILPNCSFAPLLRLAVLHGYRAADFCAVCPIRRECKRVGYLAQREQAHRKRRVIQSWWQVDGSVRDATVIIDEPSQIGLFADASFTPEHIDHAIGSLVFADISSERIGRLQEGLRQLREAVGSGKVLSRGEVASFFDHDDLQALAAQPSDPQKRKQTAQLIMEQWRQFKTANISPLWLKTLAEILTGQLEGDVWAEEGRLNLRWRDPRWAFIKQAARTVILLEANKSTEQLCAELGLSRSEVCRIAGEPEVLPKNLLQVVDVPPLHRKMPIERATRYLRLVKWSLERKGIEDDARLGILLPKRYVEVARRLWRKAFVGWFGCHDRGTNTFYEQGITTLVVIGMPVANLSCILARHGLAGQRKRVWRFYEVAGGYVAVKEFADEKAAQIVRDALRDGYRQVAGRLRQILRSEPCTLIVVGSQPTGLPTTPIFVKELVGEEAYRSVIPDASKRTEAANRVKRWAMIERMKKVEEAARLWRQVFGTDPPVGWLTKATGIPRETLKRWRRVCQNGSHDISKKETGALSLPPSCDPLWHTLPDAIKVFLTAGYPLPVRALAQRFGVHHEKVRRLARRLLAQTTSEDSPTEHVPVTLPEPASQCLQCGEPLEWEARDGGFIAACVGCGRLFEFKKGGVYAYDALSTSIPSAGSEVTCRARDVGEFAHYSSRS